MVGNVGRGGTARGLGRVDGQPITHGPGRFL